MTIKKRNRGEIPSELGWLIDTLDDLDDRISKAERPGGTQYAETTDVTARTVAYLLSLKTDGATGVATSTGTVANDGVVHYFTTTSLVQVNIDAPTQKMIVTASVGEASMTPGGSFVVGYVTYRIKDIYGVQVPGAVTGSNSGRLYTGARFGASISTGPCIHEIDPVLNPGPYEVTLIVGVWVSTLNTTPCSGTFNDPSLVVQIVGDGVT